MIQCYEDGFVRLPKPEFVTAVNAFLPYFGGRAGVITTSEYIVYIAWKD